MATAERIVKNTGLLFASEIVSKLFSFLLIMVISRYLGKVGLGEYSFAFAFVGTLSVFADMGLTTLMIRNIARERNKTSEYFNSIIGLKFVLSVAILFLSAGSIMLFATSWETIFLVWLASIALFFDNMNLTFKNLFISHDRMWYNSAVAVIERSVALIVGISALLSGYGIYGLFTALILSNFISIIFSIYYTKKEFTRIYLEFNLQKWKKLLLKSMPFWMTFVFMSIYFKIDTLMLAKMQNYAVVGLYNASYKIIDALSFIPFVVIAAVYPSLSVFHKNAEGSLKRLYEKTFKYLFTLALPIGFGITLFAGQFIVFFYGNEFIESTPALQVLVWALVFMFVNYLMGYLLNSVNQQKLFTISTGICAVINVVLNFILIPKYSFIGAAWATVATEFLNFLMLYFFTRKSGYRVKIFKNIYKPIISGAAMFFALQYLSASLNIFVLVPLGIIIYFAVLMLIRGIDYEDLKIIRKSIMPKKQ